MDGKDKVGKKDGDESSDDDGKDDGDEDRDEDEDRSDDSSNENGGLSEKKKLWFEGASDKDVDFNNPYFMLTPAWKEYKQ